MVKGFKDGSFEAIGEVRVGDEDEESGVSGIEVKIGEELKFMEVFISEEMGVIENDDGYGILGFGQIGYGILDGEKELVFSERGFCAEVISDLPVEFDNGDGGQRDVNNLVEFGIEFLHEMSKCSGFPGARGSSQESDPAFVLDEFESG